MAQQLDERLRGRVQDSTPLAFEAFVAAEVEKWTPIVKNAGVEAN